MATTTYGTPYVSGTDLVANWPAASLTVANSIDAAGYYVGRGINAQTASYTGVLTDAGKTVTMSNAGATTFTVPANSSVAYPTGTRINILNLGAGACTPTAGAGVTISGTISALATNQGAAVVKTATNTWSYLPFSSGTPVLTSSDVSSTTGSPTITTSGANTIYSFTGSGTIVLGKAGLASVLVVGGGAAGGQQGTGAGAGGGGAGGLLSASVYLEAGSQTVTIGAGGAGQTANMLGLNGISSRVGSYYGVGGGGGAMNSGTTGLAGGSGGGGSIGSTGGAGTSGQGSAGGTGFNSNAGGGGGGGSAVGANGASLVGGAGGAGVANSITGSSVTYAGGGGGSATSGTQGAGGSGGGGAGTATGSGTAGTANRGGGGGATCGTSFGGAGGSGIVIISVTT